MAKIGLRIDVDTFRGTRDGLPTLCSILKKHNIQATFFFSVGPDNMGRNLWRLFNPVFLSKMLRTNAAGMYGWDILLKGTLWPGPQIGRKLAPIIKAVADDGHEIGLHAWDHYTWQTSIEKKNVEDINHCIKRGFDTLHEICGAPPVCAAAPAWKCTDEVLLAREKFGFRFNSDCRGSSIFMPLVNGQKLSQPQIPATLPTYDELCGDNGITNSNYNEHILSLIKPEGLNVLTIHAEVEGIACNGLFHEFIMKVREQGYQSTTLGSLLPDPAQLPATELKRETIPGRSGWASIQNQTDTP
jgi:undecaprenyl phosphate-alpha-L-ara4FN deformylase